MQIDYAEHFALQTADFLPLDADVSARAMPGGKGASLHWLTHHVCGEVLVFIGWIERHEPGLALAVLDGDGRLVAKRFVPYRLQPDTTAQWQPRHYPYAAHLHLIEESTGGLKATLALEYSCERMFAVQADSQTHHCTLETGFTDWIELDVVLAAHGAASIDAHTPAIHRESRCEHVSLVRLANRSYWVGRRCTPVIPAPVEGELNFPFFRSELIVAADQNGVPGEWRGIEGSAGAAFLRSGDPLYGAIGVKALDSGRAVTVLHSEKRSYVCVLDLEAARLEEKALLRIARGRWSGLAWRADVQQPRGALWLYTNNGKLSAKHRETTLWRIDYALATKQQRLQIQTTRLTGEREVSGVCVIDYAPFTLACWNHGYAIKTVEAMRCRVYSHPQGVVAEAGVDIASLQHGFPETPATEIESFGRTLKRPAHPALPVGGFELAGKYYLAHPLNAHRSFPTGFQFGSFTLDPAML